MEFTTTYRQTTKQRRRCMICSRLIKDGQLAFFKGTRGRQGKAVHDSCRDGEPSGGWYARDCATSYVQGRLGHWTLVTDHDLEAAQMAARREADAKRFRDEHPELEEYFKQMEKEQQHG